MWVPSRERDENHIHSLFAHRCSHNRSRNLRSSFLLFVFDKRQRTTVVWGLGRQGAMKLGEELGIPMLISPGERIHSLTRVLIFIPRTQTRAFGSWWIISKWLLREEGTRAWSWIRPRRPDIDFSPLPIALRAVRGSLCSVRATTTPGALWGC